MSHDTSVIVIMASCIQQPFVLVIDDNRAAADLMVELLQASGCSSSAAYGGISGIEAITNYSPDVVLLDLLMPEVDGFEVASTINQLAMSARPVLVAFSALSDAATIKRAMMSGFDFHLPKPAMLNQVIAVIANARALKEKATVNPLVSGALTLNAAGQVPPAFSYKSGF